MSVNEAKIEAKITETLAIIQRIEKYSLPLVQKLEDCAEDLKELRQFAYDMNGAIYRADIELEELKKATAKEFDGVEENEI